MSGLSSLFSVMARKSVVYVCRYCNIAYTLGVNGTVNGCDECTGTIRNLPGGYVINAKEQCVCCDPIYLGDNENCPVHGRGK